MESIVRAVGVLAAGVAIGVQVGGAVLARPAAATGPDCGGGSAGFVAVASEQRGLERMAVGGERARISLEFVKVSEGIYGFARIGGGTRRADQVWLDWSSTGGDGWARCGPFRVTGAGEAAASAGWVATDEPERVMRACGRVDDVVRCTDWY
ncbi:hypothetical protein [Actinoplanes sp. NPDC049265]|uniref:hypothetical protein n=1 Tax=Actinoplanes sp. NPDC049265 TaxID=3363902 RepID=UPI003715C3B5